MTALLTRWRRSRKARRAVIDTYRDDMERWATRQPVDYVEAYTTMIVAVALCFALGVVLLGAIHD